MPRLELVVGNVAFPPVELADGCETVAALRDRLDCGLLGSQFRDGEKLQFAIKASGDSRLQEKASLPKAPAKLYVVGPVSAVRALTFALNNRFQTKTDADPSPGALTERLPNSARLSGLPSALQGPASARGKSKLATALAKRGSSDEFIVSGLVDSDSASAVLSFWFDELTPDDWFRQSHSLDDRIRHDFGALHGRAAAGELTGWVSRPDTCLALVILLDQFTRILYRGTPGAFGCDSAARVAANMALARGDDRNYWRPGARRSALYLPFMHSEDMADKRRAVALMREGLKPAWTNKKEVNFGGNDVQSPKSNADKALNSGSGTALPRLVMALNPQRSPRNTSSNKTTRGLLSEGSSAVSSNQGFGLEDDSDGSHSSDEDSTSSEEEENQVPFLVPLGSKGTGSAQNKASAPGGGKSPRGSAGKNKHATSRTYSMQAALDMIPNMVVSTLNHEHAKRFRCMRLDAQTEQAYRRDRTENSNRTCRYYCMVCAVNHEFRLSKGAAGADH